MLRFQSILWALTLSLCVGSMASPRAAEAQDQVDIEAFYDQLAPYGTWFESGEFGWVWQPTDVYPGWRPYSDGHWAWTDDYGWYWVSDAEWGWATDHYGRWFRDPDRGWLWVPGAEWAPAWVAWRSGEGYTGWAPLPPSVRWRAGVGLSFGGGDVSLAVAPDAWVFVEDRGLLAPRAYEVAYAPSENRVLIGRTRYVTRYDRRPHGIYNYGVPRDRVEYSLHAHVPRLQIAPTTRYSDIHRMHGDRGTVNVYRPSVRITHGHDYSEYRTRRSAPPVVEHSRYREAPTRRPEPEYRSAPPRAAAPSGYRPREVHNAPSSDPRHDWQVEHRRPAPRRGSPTYEGNSKREAPDAHDAPRSAPPSDDSHGGHRRHSAPARDHDDDHDDHDSRHHHGH
jgi:hypothetical protein